MKSDFLEYTKALMESQLEKSIDLHQDVVQAINVCFESNSSAQSSSLLAVSASDNVHRNQQNGSAPTRRIRAVMKDACTQTINSMASFLIFNEFYIN